MRVQRKDLDRAVDRLRNAFGMHRAVGTVPRQRRFDERADGLGVARLSDANKRRLAPPRVAPPASARMVSAPRASPMPISVVLHRVALRNPCVKLGICRPICICRILGPMFLTVLNKNSMGSSYSKILASRFDWDTAA